MSVQAPKRGTWRGLALLRSFMNGNASSAISSDFTIEGNVRCNGHARLDGAIFGDVVCKDLVVGQNGHIVGDVKAETIVVYGIVSGSVYCRMANLKSGSSIEGDIFHEDLAIEVGARFAGKSIRLHAHQDHSEAAEAGNEPAAPSQQA